jgi:Mn2+/Fe2+ NRAMP family transporter
MMLLVNNKKIMGEYVNRPMNNVIGWGTVGIMVILSVMLLFSPLLNFIKNL